MLVRNKMTRYDLGDDIFTSSHMPLLAELYVQKKSKDKKKNELCAKFSGAYKQVTWHTVV